MPLYMYVCPPDGDLDLNFPPFSPVSPSFSTCVVTCVSDEQCPQDDAPADPPLHTPPPLSLSLSLSLSLRNYLYRR